MRYLLFALSLFLAFIAGTFVPSVRSQDDGVRVVTVHYMKVKPGLREDYLRMERNLWKPAHELLISEKRMRAWSLYEVKALPPTGPNKTDDSRDHDFVTFTVADPANLARYEGQALRAVHPDKTPESIHLRTLATRDTVHREVWTLVDDAR